MQFAWRTAELIAKRSAVYRLKNPYRDGTTHFVFDPLEFTTHIHVRGPAGSLRLCKSALLPICPGPAGGAGAGADAAATRQPGQISRGPARLWAPNARHRSKVVPATPGLQRRSHAQVRAHALDTAHREADHHRPTAPMTWMERQLRVFG